MTSNVRTPESEVDSVLDLFRLDGRVAVTTGASSGLGAGFARALAELSNSTMLPRRSGHAVDAA